MSGGSLNYAYVRLEEVAAEIEARATTPEHRAFAMHVLRVSEALHDLEWVWSYDYKAGDEMRAIMTCITRADVIRQAIVEGERALERLDQALRGAGPQLHEEERYPTERPR